MNLNIDILYGYLLFFVRDTLSILVTHKLHFIWASYILQNSESFHFFLLLPGTTDVFFGTQNHGIEHLKDTRALALLIPID